MEETLTWANPIETEKIRTHHAKIVVECTTGKPYYSIEWFDPAKQEYYLGYSSYNIENVLGWLSECFEIVDAPKTNAERIRNMTDEELALFVRAFINSSRCPYDWKSCENCWLKELCNANAYNGELEWLQAPAEGE